MKPKNIKDKEKVLTAPREKEQINTEESIFRHETLGSEPVVTDKRQVSGSNICKEFKKRVSWGAGRWGGRTQPIP